MSAKQRGALLFAHGARDAAWAAPFEAVAASLRERSPQTEVRLAFLEFMAPDLQAAGQQLVDSGCTAVTIVPLFLGAGGHVRKDVPELLERLRLAHPVVQWTLAPTIGEQPVVIDAMAQAAFALCLPTQEQA